MFATAIWRRSAAIILADSSSFARKPWESVSTAAMLDVSVALFSEEAHPAGRPQNYTFMQKMYRNLANVYDF